MHAGTFEPNSLCKISGFYPIPQSFVKKLVGPACPPSQISARAQSPRPMPEPPNSFILVHNHPSRVMPYLVLCRMEGECPWVTRSRIRHKNGKSLLA
jgi:hypothetical protein